MDIKDCIELCTKVNKNQGLNNVKWSKVPKDNKQSPDQYQKKPLPHHLEMERNLHEPSKKHSRSKKHDKKNQEKDEKFQVLEIKEGIQEVSVGWNVMLSIEKRYKEAQKKYAAETMDNSSSSESNISFPKAHATIITKSDDSFLSTTQDFEQLKISEIDKNIQSKVLHDTDENKELYKRNALMKGIMQNKENIYPSASKNSKNTSDLLIKPLEDKKNLQRNENKQKMHENKVLKSVGKEGTSKTCKSMKKSIKKEPKQKNHLGSKAAKVTDNSRKHFMEVSDDCFCEFVPTKSMKS